MTEPKVEAGDRALETARKIRRFPIMGGPSIPWESIAPYDSQAKHNHGQTLEELAKRGGLSPAEAWHVLNNSDFGVRTNWEKSEIDGKALLAQINQRYETLQQEVDRLQSAMNAQERELVKTLRELRHASIRYAKAMKAIADDEWGDLKGDLETEGMAAADNLRTRNEEAERLLAERGEGR